MGDVHLTKASAAFQLVESAIQMVERGDDDLAVVVVASSATNLIRELLQTRGVDFADEITKAGLFDYAKLYIEGELPEVIQASPLLEIIQTIASGIVAGDLKTPSDIVVNYGGGRSYHMLQPLTEPYNFLKHADRDPLAALEANKFKPHVAVVAALAAFTMAFPDHALTENMRRFAKRSNDEYEVT